MSGDVRRTARRLAWERLARSLHSCVSSSHRSSSFDPNCSRGSISRTTRYTWDRVIRGIFSPPFLLQVQQECPAQQAQGHVVMPALPKLRVSYSSNPTSLFSVSNSVSIRHREPPTYARVSNRSILRSVGQVVAGFAAVQIPAVNGPVDFAGLPLAWLARTRWALKLVAAGTLASLGHRYLPPGILRQLIAALRPWCAAAHPTSLGLRGDRPNPW